jgi:hypothetical protein
MKLYGNAEYGGYNVSIKLIDVVLRHVYYLEQGIIYRMLYWEGNKQDSRIANRS